MGKIIKMFGYPWMLVVGFAVFFLFVAAFMAKDVAISVKTLYILNNEISILNQGDLNAFFTTVLIFTIAVISFFLLYYHPLTSAPTKLIAVSIALAILLPSAYICLTEFASQTINVFNWGSALILAYIISSQFVPTAAKSQNPTHSG